MYKKLKQEIMQTRIGGPARMCTSSVGKHLKTSWMEITKSNHSYYMRSSHCDTLLIHELNNLTNKKYEYIGSFFDMVWIKISLPLI